MHDNDSKYDFMYLDLGMKNAEGEIVEVRPYTALPQAINGSFIVINGSVPGINGSFPSINAPPPLINGLWTRC